MSQYANTVLVRPSHNHEIFHRKIFYYQNISAEWSPPLHPLKTGDDLIRSSFKTILICFHSFHSKNRSFCVELDALKGLEIKQSVIVVLFVATLIVQWIVISQLEFKLNPNLPRSFLYIYNSNVSEECVQTQNTSYFLQQR